VGRDGADLRASGFGAGRERVTGGVMKTYPEINALNARQVREALDLGYVNLRSVKPDCQAELIRRLKALQQRLRRLRATEEHIGRTEAAL
jgi:hypothetical protein